MSRMCQGQGQPTCCGDPSAETVSRCFLSTRSEPGLGKPADLSWQEVSAWGPGAEVGCVQRLNPEVLEGLRADSAKRLHFVPGLALSTREQPGARAGGQRESPGGNEANPAGCRLPTQALSEEVIRRTRLPVDPRAIRGSHPLLCP